MTGALVGSPSPHSDEAGFTLIELLVYSLLSVLVLLIVGGVLINSLSVERRVREASQASTAGQLVSKSLGQGIRNASAIRLTTPSTGTQLVTARTASAGSIQEWSCQAWYYGAGEVRTATSNAAIPAPTPEGAKQWTLLGSGMEPLASTPVFALNGRRVDLNLQVSTGEGSTMLIKTAASSRQPVPPTGEETSPCF